MERDGERIARLLARAEEKGLDYVLFLDPENIHYLCGGVIDYSAAYLDVGEGRIVAIANVMEAERIPKVTWVDDIIVYYRDRYDGPLESVKAENLYDAVGKVLDGGKIGVPYGFISKKEFDLLSEKLEGLIDFSEDLWRARMIKSRREIALLREAARIVDEGIKWASERLDRGLSEYSLMVESKCYMLRRGADKTLDFLIVASGPNSAYPHWRCSDRVPRPGDAVTLDYVASYNGYFGDETRTFFVGMAETALKRIYEVVLEAQVEAIEKAGPGVKAKEVDEVARRIIERNGYGKYFTHSTGHGIGLNVHEPPRLSSKSEYTLEPGMVVTIEPGIYVEGLGGVRIEDMVLITEDGCEVLTSLSKAIEII